MKMNPNPYRKTSTVVARHTKPDNRSGISRDVDLNRIQVLAEGQEKYLLSHPGRYAKIWDYEYSRDPMGWSGVQVMCGGAGEVGYFVGRSHKLTIGDAFEFGPHICPWARETLPMKGKVIRAVEFSFIQSLVAKKLHPMPFCYEVLID